MGITMKKRTKIILAVCLAVLIAVGLGGYGYLSSYYPASDAAVAALAVQVDRVQVEQDRKVTWFVPDQPTAGLIFYPGGKVACEAYAPLLRACAENGVLCTLVKMPGNLAVLSQIGRAHV